MLGRLLTLAVALCSTVVACASPDPSPPLDTSSSTVPTSSVATSTTTSTAPTTTVTLEAAAPTTLAPDTTPPTLTVTHPDDGETVSRETIDFHGTGETATTVAIDGVGQAVVDADGGWGMPVTLAWGDSEFRISSQDQVGNETVIVIEVRYTPPMPCNLHEIQTEHQSDFPTGPVDWCGGWGYVRSVDVADAEVVFDLAQVELTVPGDESQGWTIVNNNPGLRTLPVGTQVEVRACPPDAGESVPGPGCGEPWVGSPWGFSLWTLEGLEDFVNAGHDFWLVLIDPPSGEVVWVEQWWNP